MKNAKIAIIGGGPMGLAMAYDFPYRYTSLSMRQIID